METTMTSIHLNIEPLTKEAFAPYGDVIETEGSDHFTINNGFTERYHDLARVDVSPEVGNGRTLINIFAAKPLSYPLDVKMVERHPLGSQAFIPLQGRPYLVLVSKAGDEPVDPKSLRAFHARGNQGVNYLKGTWHHPVLALEEDQNFLVVDRGGEGHNCDEFYFGEDVGVVLAGV